MYTNMIVTYLSHYEQSYDPCVEGLVEYPMDINMLFNLDDNINMLGELSSQNGPIDVLIREEEEKILEEDIILNVDHPFKLILDQIKMLYDNIMEKQRMKYDI